MENHDLEDSFEEYLASLPESKLEMLDGRLIVGNSLDGSRWLWREILSGWGAEAAVALGTVNQWLEALCRAYGLTPPASGSLALLETQAAAIEFQPPDLRHAGAGRDGAHDSTRRFLDSAIHRVTHQLHYHAIGRDFVMRLGESCFTPDLLLAKGDRSPFHNYYLDGPAELVIEVVGPMQADYDYEIKREKYARGGVSEYVIVDPVNRKIDFHRLTDGEYQAVFPDADGKYRPRSVPGLAIVIDEVWARGDIYRSDKRPFVVEDESLQSPFVPTRNDGLSWGSVPFAPRLSLSPEKIRFEEFISWCPEAKFEGWDGRIQICGRTGIRHLIGMLAMTFGLTEACRLIAPLDWVKALRDRQAREERQPEIKDKWWQKAREIAALLREKYGAKKVAVTGDLLESQPLGYWSELTLMAWEANQQEFHNIYADLQTYRDADTPDITVENGSSSYLQTHSVADDKIVEL